MKEFYSISVSATLSSYLREDRHVSNFLFQFLGTFSVFRLLSTDSKISITGLNQSCEISCPEKGKLSNSPWLLLISVMFHFQFLQIIFLFLIACAFHMHSSPSCSSPKLCLHLIKCPDSLTPFSIKMSVCGVRGIYLFRH